jgi:hypothetical protein
MLSFEISIPIIEKTGTDERQRSQKFAEQALWQRMDPAVMFMHIFQIDSPIFDKRFTVEIEHLSQSFVR